jgi:capsular polysaccharide transport system ATP-binding protein
MIVLNSVSKEVGRGRLKKLVLDNISWVLPPRHNFVILGQRGSGKSTLLDIVAGRAIPTHGWVDRRAQVSVPDGLLKFGGYDTPRKLIKRMSQLYQVDPLAVAEFAVQANQMQEVMDLPLARLPGWLRTQLNLALTYAFPCDYYLFDGTIEAGRKPEFRAFCRRAFEIRSQTSATIVVTGSTKTAKGLANNATGGLLHHGKLTLYQQLEDAITVFESLPPPPQPSVAALASAEPEAPVVEDEF